MDLSLSLSLALVFFSVTGMVLALSRLVSSSDSRVDARIDGVTGNPAMDRTIVKQLHREQSAGWAFLAQITSYLLPRKAEQRTRFHQDLIRAGYESPSAPVVFLLMQIVATVVLATAAGIGAGARGFSSTDSLLAAVMAACGGYLLPRLWLRRRTRARQRVLKRSLPDFLDLTVTCLQGGMIFDAAIQRVSKELEPAHPLLSYELGRVRQEIELGSTADRALLTLSERTNLDAIRSLALVCQQSRRLGTKLVSALRVHSDTLRDRRESDAEESAQKAAVKILLPTLLCLFPCVFVILAGPAAIQITEEFGKARAEESRDAEE